MTVDMLAATFFWPEGTLLGSRHTHPDDETEVVAEEDQTLPCDEVPADGFWSAVMRHLWRPPALTAEAP